MQSPDSARQFLFQRAATAYYGTLYYSPGALFTGGTPTSRATATDEVIINDSGAIFPYIGAVADYGGVVAAYADTASPYGFYFLGWTKDWTTIYIRIVFDPLADTDPSDTDPYIWHIGSGASNPDNFTYTNVASETTSTGGVSRCVGTLGNGTFKGTIPGMYFRDSSVISIPWYGQANRFQNQMVTYPIAYARRSDLADPGYKGTGSIVRWTSWTSAEFGATLANRTRIIFGAINVPWNGSIPVTGIYG
jgi:hypothetical protein